jgi:FAD/FMN-containing dehydrogenase
MLTTEHPAEELRARVAGSVVVPGDAGWDEARRAWNLAVDQLPELVALPEGVLDVAEIVRFARRRGLRVAVQGTGHGAAPLDLEGALLLKTERMRRVEVDVATRRARVEAGALWGDVVRPASGVGLMPLAGSSHDVGVVGYTLGGGIGWLSRRYGLAANSVLAAEVVCADGRLLRVDRETDPELFWALRGGGGSFAAVVALEFALYPVLNVYAGTLLWPWERAPEVLRAWSQLAASAPDALTSVGRLLQLPPLPELPEPLRGGRFVGVEVAFDGTKAEGSALIAGLRALAPLIDTVTTVPAARLLQLHMDPPGPVPGIGDGFLLDEFPAEAADALAAVGGEGSGSPLVSLEVRHLDGALASAPDGHGALARLDGRFAVYGVGIPAGPDVAAAVTAHFPRVRDALTAWDSGRAYLNFAEQETDLGSAFPAETLDRLRAVKLRYDPADVFRANHRIQAGT